jgi:alpha-1,2-mannosyltransferase
MSVKTVCGWAKQHHRALLLTLVVALWLWQWVIAMHDPRDFGVYYRTGQRILAGQSIYDYADDSKLCYKYSPLFAFAFAPLALLPLRVAQALWFLVNAAATAALFPLAYRTGAVGGASGAAPLGRHVFWVYLAAFGLSARYAFLNATSGQVVAIQLALVLAAVLLVERERPWLGGLLLGLAILIKISPVLLVGYLLLRRRYQAVVATGVLSVGWALLPSLRFGLAGNVRLFLEWLDFIQQQNTLDQLTRSQNQSLLAVLNRLLVSSPSGMNLVDLPLEQVKALHGPILFGVFAVLLVLLWRWVQRAPAGGAEVRLRASLAVVLMHMTVFSPLAWRYNYLTVIVPWVFLTDLVARGHRERRTFVLMGVAFCLAVFTNRDLLGRGLERWVQLLGAEMWGGCLATYACFDAAHRWGRRVPEGSLAAPEQASLTTPT